MRGLRIGFAAAALLLAACEDDPVPVAQNGAPAAQQVPDRYAADTRTPAAPGTPAATLPRAGSGTVEAPGAALSPGADIGGPGADTGIDGAQTLSPEIQRAGERG